MQTTDFRTQKTNYLGESVAFAADEEWAGSFLRSASDAKFGWMATVDGLSLGMM